MKIALTIFALSLQVILNAQVLFIGDVIFYTRSLDTTGEITKYLVSSNHEANEIAKEFQDKYLLVFIDPSDPSKFDISSRGEIPRVYRIRGINGIHAYQDIIEYQAMYSNGRLVHQPGSKVSPIYKLYYYAPSGGNIKLDFPPTNRLFWFIDKKPL